MEQVAAAESVFLSTVPTSPRDRQLARWMVLASFAIFSVLAPFARVKLIEVWAFIPSYEAAMLVLDLTTAAMMFAQFGLIRSPQLLVLAGGYLFCAVMALVHMLSFPRLFAATGLLGAGPQTTAWLYMDWHAGFPLAVIAYVWLRNRRPVRRARRAILAAVGVVAAFIGGMLCLASAGYSILPTIMIGDSHAPALPFVVGGVWLLSLAALAVLWLHRPHVSLDSWLMVVMSAWLFDIALGAMLNAGRFDLGFYAGRVYGLFSASLVLTVLLLKTGALYAKMSNAFAMERQAQEQQLQEMRLELIHASRLTELGQMAATLAHEVNQPLTALASYVLAGRRLLNAGEAAKADDALERAVAQITRTSDVIKRLRQFVRRGPNECRLENIRQTVEEAADFAMIGREGRATRLTVEYAPDTPAVLIDKVQIQQVLLNLIRNAVEAMQANQLRELAIKIGPLDGMVEVTVMDRGPGLPPAVLAKLFQPFVTTKSAGMGVGLSICRSIIEAHGGHIWATDNAGGGTAFHFTLPVFVMPDRNRQPLDLDQMFA